MLYLIFMANPSLTKLYSKVQKVLLEINSLKKDRQKLLAELELVHEESRKSRRVLRNYEDLIKERSTLKQKIEQLVQKLDKLSV